MFGAVVCFRESAAARPGVRLLSSRLPLTSSAHFTRGHLGYISLPLLHASFPFNTPLVLVNTTPLPPIPCILPVKSATDRSRAHLPHHLSWPLALPFTTSSCLNISPFARLPHLRHRRRSILFSSGPPSTPPPTLSQFPSSVFPTNH
ncbi:hypothetical protein QCA50_003023 [Cerrena zonata]|uniref:Uncharacterized protein n=1 Tax=Cerrena zonata TaxID=2478898 RepID=A0AAW0GQY4_9APHY